MSDRPKQPFATMMYTARLLVAKLQPACERIEIAGSLRRQRPLVSDIEIVAVPKPILNLIGEPTGRTEVDDMLDTLPVYFTKRGRKYAQFWFDGSTLPFYVDLFLPLPECWSVIYMIRTGSSAFSQKMVTAKSQGGYRPEHLHVRDGRVWDNGKPIDVESEADLFRLWNMGFVPPQERTGL